MITPVEFMAFATPLCILIDRLVGNRLDRIRAEQASAQLAKAQLNTSQEVSAQVRYSSQQNAVQSASLTAKALAPAAAATENKLETIHTLVNGNLTAANDKIAALEAEVELLRKKNA